MSWSKYIGAYISPGAGAGAGLTKKDKTALGLTGLGSNFAKQLSMMQPRDIVNYCIANKEFKKRCDQVIPRTNGTKLYWSANMAMNETVYRHNFAALLRGSSETLNPDLIKQYWRIIIYYNRVISPSTSLDATMGWVGYPTIPGANGWIKALHNAPHMDYGSRNNNLIVKKYLQETYTPDIIKSIMHNVQTVLSDEHKTAFKRNNPERFLGIGLEYNYQTGECRRIGQ